MNPEYFLIPLLMGQAAGIIESIKTGVVVIDFLILIGIVVCFYSKNQMRFLKQKMLAAFKQNKNSIVISSEHTHRSLKFRALMYHLTQLNPSIYQLREDNMFEWDEGDDKVSEKRSEYLVDQTDQFQLTPDIMGIIRNETKERTRMANATEMIELDNLTIFSNRLSLFELQQWIDEKVFEFKNILRRKSNERQLFITVSNMEKSSASAPVNKRKKPSSAQHNLSIDSIPWSSSITFENSYFHAMEETIKKIDFFLHNKAWYIKKGIPYTLGILLYGEPGCGKTRFLKQFMNYTGRHCIDIKLNDLMDFADLQQVIYKEEIDDTHIIPQDQRIIVFEDIDALGDVVKERASAAGTSAAGAGTSSEGTGTSYACAASTASTASTAGTGRASPSEIHETKLMMSEFLKAANKTKNNNLSYLLNMLDGIHECSGRIIIMTTNKVEVLDKALIRPGRIDIKLHFQRCTRYDIKRMIEKFWDIEIDEESLKPELEYKYTSAEVINQFRSTDDFETIREIFIKN